MKFKHITTIAVLGLSLAACKKTTGPEFNTEKPVPTTYNFTNQNFTTSTQRISMLAEITTYIKTAHTTTASPALSAQKMKDMYANTASQFTDAALNSSGIQLKSVTDNTYNLQVELDAALTDIGTVSQTTPTGSNGVAGKVVSGTKAYLMDANGFEYKEVFEKGAMAGVFYYQAMKIMNNIASYDNTTIVAGQGTAMEHAWDEAFGYFGVPTDFPTNITGLKNWGSYCNSVNAATGLSATIMNAFLAGRHAIGRKDDATRNANRDVVMASWEKVAAARCITYLKSAKTNIADDAVRNHNLSEAAGFIKTFKYNPSKKITDVQISQLEGYLGTNLYTVTSTNMDNIINSLASIFSLNSAAL
jgi:hypothetical protein